MKKIYLLLLTAIFVASCSLEEVAYKTDEAHVKDAHTSESLLLGIYERLGSDGIYRNNLPFVFGLATDETKMAGSGLSSNDSVNASNAFNTSSSHVQLTWQTLYSAVYYANYFIELMGEKMPTFTTKDQEKCKYYMAEAKALRALLYFELVRWYGNVPLVLSPDESYRKPEEFIQADPVTVYEQIETDLKDAIKVLPYAQDDKIRNDNSFRISQGGARGLLVKVYATWAGYPLRDETKWECAVAQADTLISSGKHGLLSKYDQLWKNSGNNKWDPAESLLELSYWSPLATEASCGRVGIVNGVMATSGGLTGGSHSRTVKSKIHPTFLMNWKDYDKDLRFGLTYADYRYTATGKKGITIKKIGGVDTDVTFLMAWLGNETYPDSWNMSWRFGACYDLTNGKWDTEIYVPAENNQINSNYSNVNWYLLRYADVLLLYAEALNEVNNGPTAEAYEAINMVRRRGFGLDVNTPSADADLEAGLSYDEFQEAIINERSWELAGEGHRRTDLVRWGIYYEKIKETYDSLADWYDRAQDYFIAGEYTTKNKHELLPIPQREVDLCGYKQNPGW